MKLTKIAIGKSRKITGENKKESWVTVKLEYENDEEDYTTTDIEGELEYILESLEKTERERWLLHETTTTKLH